MAGNWQAGAHEPIGQGWQAAAHMTMSVLERKLGASRMSYFAVADFAFERSITHWF